MYNIYVIEDQQQIPVYVGATTRPIQTRFKQHVSDAKRSSQIPIHTCMRENGIENFNIKKFASVDTQPEAIEIEKMLIAEYSGHLDLLNCTKGGELGVKVIKDKESWKEKLKKARSGRQPALGMKHNEENKKLFSDVSNAYWDTQETYDPQKISGLSHKEAKLQLGISTTHYYRLKKRLANSDDVS